MLRGPVVNDDLVESIERVVEATGELVGELAELLLFGRVGEESGRGVWDPENCSYNELFDLLRQAQEAGAVEELALVLRALAERGPQIEGTIIAWISLIEELVQHTERRYGRGRGRGVVKASDVRAIVDYLLRSEVIFPARVPRAVRNLAADVVGGWITAAIVDLANRYELWTTVEEEPRSIGARIELWLKKALLRLKPLGEIVAAAFDGVWRLFRRRPPLTPGLLTALRGIERTRIAAAGDVAETSAALFRWVASHGPQAVATVRLVFTSVYEVERFVDMTGPEKKAYVRDTVLCVLYDLGLPLESPFVRVIAAAFVDGSIEAAVHLFDKRGAFVQADAA